MYFLLIYLLKFTFFFAIEILEYQFDSEISPFSVYYQNSYCMNQQLCLLGIFLLSSLLTLSQKYSSYGSENEDSGKWTAPGESWLESSRVE